jgi:hypothetical protein
MRGRGTIAKAWRAFAALSAAGLLSACTHLQPPLPTPGPAGHPPEIGESVITLEARADYAAMSAAANSAVAAQVVDLKAVNLGHGVTFKLTGERSDIKVSRVEAGVGFSTSFHVDGVLDSRCVIVIHCTGGLSVDGRLWGAARPTILPDWTLNLAPSGGFEVDKALVHVAVFPVDVPVKDQVTKALKKSLDKAILQIDDATGRGAALKSAAQAAWTELGRPIPISADPPVWLRVHPTRILTEQPVITDKDIALNVALVARPELIVGEKPADADPGAIPDLNIVPTLPQQFSIYLPVRLTWEDASGLAQRNLAGRDLQAGGGVTVRLDQLSIFNNGDEVGVRIDFHARSSGGWAPSGVIYLLGKPVYHLEDGYIAVEHLHLDLETRDLVLKLAAFLAQQSVLDEIEARLHFDMRDQVAARRQDLDKAINGAQLNPKLSLAGEVSSLAPSAVYLTREGLQVNVVALGNLKLVAR